MTNAMPAAEVDIDGELVHRLLLAQAPELAGLRLGATSNGWDNVLVRLGDRLVARLPRRQAAADLVDHEQRWLPVLAPLLPLPVPAPVVAGRPGEGFPWAWTVAPWFPGEAAATTPPRDQQETVATLAGFFDALHRPAPSDAPRNPFRGGPLGDRDAPTGQRLEQLAGLIDADRAGALWSELRAAPAWARPPVWLHGDLHAANIVVDDGRLAAVVDWGDITAGDPATDLAVAWQLLDADHRATLFERLGTDGDTRARARGWALALSLAYLASSADNVMMAAIGGRTLAAVLAGP